MSIYKGFSHQSEEDSISPGISDTSSQFDNSCEQERESKVLLPTTKLFAQPAFTVNPGKTLKIGGDFSESNVGFSKTKTDEKFENFLQKQLDFEQKRLERQLAAEKAHFKSQTGKAAHERKDSSRIVTESEGINNMPLRMKSPQNKNSSSYNLNQGIITRSNSARQLKSGLDTKSQAKLCSAFAAAEGILDEFSPEKDVISSYQIGPKKTF